ncbi:MAG: carbamoyltransferase, partial [Acidobacteria bacterium]|nr:carbamoyltransferase [Acidobacteriota bacterium]
KVMGLAAYGQPEYQDEFEKIVRLDSSPARSNGRAPFHLGLDYFVHHKTGPEMTWREGSPVLGKLYSDFLDTRLGPSRKAGAVVDRRHEQIAATVQARLEEAVFTLLNRLYELHGIKKLCLAGGVAFNCVTNGKIFQRTPFEEIFIQPAAGDAGLAVGAAFYVWHQILGRPRSFEMQHAYWGPEFSRARIGEEVAKLRMADAGLRIEEAAEEALVKKTAQRIAEGRVVGWFQGRMEWGPRALGNRSILTDPRRPEMKEVLNARIKRREPFRPFCPSILAEAVDEYFEGARHDPFMITVYPIKPEKHSVIPAVTHVDGTGRLQSVRREDNPLYRELIQAFRQLTGVPVLLNTSFNENEPIVNTPAEAVDCFLRTKMDVLAIGPYFLEKKTSSTDAHG